MMPGGMERLTVRGTTRLSDGVYSPRLAAKLARITPRKLRYWGTRELVTPSIYKAPPGGRDLYSYTDLVQARVVSRLRDQGASLQKVRKAIEWLREQVAAGEDWHTRTLVTDGTTVFAFLGPDEVYDAAKRQGQRVFTVALGEVERDLADIGREMGIGDRVRIIRGVLGGAPIIRGTRIPTSFISQLAHEGQSAEEIVSHYPGMEVDDVRAAVDFESKLMAAG